VKSKRFPAPHHSMYYLSQNYKQRAEKNV